MDISEVVLYAFGAVCVISFAVYYADPVCRMNPVFEGQMHCISGILLCNRPFFSLIMTSFSGLILLVLGLRIVDESRKTVLMSLAVTMYIAFVSVLSYDVHEHKPVHFFSLFVLLVASTSFIQLVNIPPWCLIVYDSVLVCFVLIMISNFMYLQWTPPCMTIQALLEILWVVAMCFCLWMYISSSSRSG
jgi:hypothetical protein